MMEPDLRDSNHSSQREKSSPSNGFFRLTKALLYWLGISESSSPTASSNLTDHVRKLEDIVQEILPKLQSSVETLETQLDDRTFAYVKRIVDPMVRDADRIHKMTDKLDTEYQQLEVVEKYNQWISEAERLVEVFSEKRNNRIEVMRTLIQHTMNRTRENITKDFQIIRDYKDHRIAELQLNPKEKNKLSKRMDDILVASFLTPLVTMHDEQVQDDKILRTMTESQVVQKNINQQRSESTEGAFHVIDTMVQEIKEIHSLDPLKELQRSHTNPSDLNELEMSLALLLGELKKQDLAESTKSTLLTTLLDLEKKADLIETELETFPEAMKRLHQIKQNLEEAHRLFNS